jgi:hypothetical protein
VIKQAWLHDKNTDKAGGKGMRDKVCDRPRDPLASPLDPLYPFSVKAVMGVALWLAVLAWGFFTGRGYVLIILGLLTWLALMTAALLSILTCMGRGVTGQPNRRSAYLRDSLIVVLPVAIAGALVVGEVVVAAGEAPSRSATACGPRTVRRAEVGFALPGDSGGDNRTSSSRSLEQVLSQPGETLGFKADSQTV